MEKLTKQLNVFKKANDILKENLVTHQITFIGDEPTLFFTVKEYQVCLKTEKSDASATAIYKKNFSCSCPAFAIKNGKHDEFCSHILAVLVYLCNNYEVVTKNI